MSEKKNILMFGPGHGHNIKKWLDFFEDNSAYNLTFLANTPFAFESDTIDLINKKSNVNLLKLLPKLRRKKYDLLIIHGGFNWRVLTLLLFLLRYKKSVFIPWGLKITQLASARNLGGFMYRLCFKKVDHITSTYSIQQAIEEKLPSTSHKLIMFLWGLDMRVVNSKEDTTPFTKNFLNSFKPNDIFVFYPRSIIRVTHFDLVLQALNQIKEHIPVNTRFVIWHGNETDVEYKTELEDYVEKHGLNTIVEFVQHPFLPDNDIYAIWRRANFSVNIIKTDGLSSQFMEALLFEKPILLSEISTYTPIDKQYELELDFTLNTTNNIAEGLKEMFTNNGSYNKELLKKRSQFARKHFNFEANVEELLQKTLF